MANTTISPNMNMPVPVVGTDPGPDWANNVNSCLSILDSHTHTPGQGVLVTPAGMDINSDLTMGSNNLTTVRSVRFDPQSAPLALAADIGCLYESGVDLYYNDALGNQVRITQSGSVTGATGTITGLPSGTASASYAAGTFTFQGATNTPATMNVGPIVSGAAVALSKTVTITPSAVQAADYSLTWPLALPASTSFMSVDSSGNMGTIATSTITSGTYSPTLTWNGNAPTINTQYWYYTRIGSIVNITGFLDITTGTSAAVQSITIPIATTTVLPTGIWLVNVVGGSISTGYCIKPLSGNTQILFGVANPIGASTIGRYQFTCSYIIN